MATRNDLHLLVNILVQNEFKRRAVEHRMKKRVSANRRFFMEADVLHMNISAINPIQHKFPNLYLSL